MIIIFTSCNNTNTLKEDSIKKIEVVSTNITEETKLNTKTIVTDPMGEINGNIQGLIGGCGYNYSPGNEKIEIYEPGERELNQINSILKFTGLSSNFKIYAASIDNAVATIINNKRYILYDPKLLSFTDMKSGNYWSSMSILAHEIGHHLSGHTITNIGSNPKDELEADKYSGFILYKLGASLEEATNAIRTLETENGSATHPPRFSRIEAISEGWNSAFSQLGNSAVPPPNTDDEEINKMNLKFELGDFYIKEDIINYYLDYTYSNYGVYEGVITIKSNDNGNNFLYVFLTKIPTTNKYDFYFKIGAKEKIFYNFPSEADNVRKSWFNEIIQPGRKIQFAFTMEGSGGFCYLTYLRALKRSD